MKLKMPNGQHNAGLFLCLALASIVLLGGCGGSSDSSPTAAQGPPGNEASATAKRASGVKSAGPKHGASGDPSKHAPKEAESAAAGGKHGAHVAPPKGKLEKAPTPSQVASAAVANISLSSPVLSPGPESSLLLPTTYTCKGKDSWPSLSWTGVPSDTAELDLLVMNLESQDGRLFFDWAVAGIKPDLSGLEAGALPPGAVVGRNSLGKTGYSICPADPGEIHIFALYAVPQELSADRGFDPAELRKRVQSVSHSVGLLAATTMG
jgi:phosphatidylethanolamine-binding protein (PEBP) family uncharacterized protein